jgi:hypothetical protein
MTDRIELDVDKVAKVIEDLLQVAQGAIPAELFAVDPRIIRAQH